MSSERGSPTRLALALGLLGALVIAAASAWLRVHAALADPTFDAVNPRGMLRSDPALLYYFIERIVESGGWIPADFRAEPRILHPATVDVLAHFPIGYELVAAWTYRWFGGSLPLHTFCVHLASLCAAATVLPIYGLALELTRRVRHALLAALVFASLLANYRTVGFVLVGEDFSLPWLALHLFLLARAVRVRTAWTTGASALALVIAMATWQATGFFVALEALVVLAWWIRSGENPLAAPKAWVFVAIAAAGCVLVPILRATGTWASAPMLALAALAVGAHARRRTTHARSIAAGIGAACALAALGLLAGGGQREYSHVFGLVWQKIVNLGELPRNPLELPGEVRLMWQGPFATATLVDLVRGLGLALGVALVVCVVGLPRWWKPADGRVTGVITCLSALLALALPAAWLIERTIVLAGMLVPVAAALAPLLVTQRRKALVLNALVVLLAVLQPLGILEHFDGFTSAWNEPRSAQAELRTLLDAVESHVPKDEAIASDFVISTAVLAHTRRGIVLQPKYEDRQSRERALEFFDAYFRGTPAQLRELLLSKYRCRYLLVDRRTLDMPVSRYVGGLPLFASPVGGTCWEVFGESDDERLRRVPGFELLYRSPETLRDERGGRSDRFRLYALAP